MSKPPSAASIQKRYRDGYGQGELEEYKPWITRQRGPRNFERHGIQGIKINRGYALFASYEKKYFYILEFFLRLIQSGLDTIIDIREQYPLWPNSETVKIAEQCGVNHPYYPKSKPRQPIVMTSDFCITMQKPNGRKYNIIRTVKPSGKLEPTIKQKDRVLQKFEIERRFWKKKNINWGIVTEREINDDFADNLEKIRGFYKQSRQLHDLTKRDIYDIAFVLTKRVADNPNTPLRELGHDCDHQLGFSSTTTLGTSISTAKHLIANRYWIINLLERFDEAQPLNLIHAPIEKIMGDSNA